MEPKYVKRRQRAAAVVAASLILIIGAVVYIGVQLAARPNADYQGAGNGTVVLVEVPQGSSMSELGPDLVDKGVVAGVNSFLTATANNPDASRIQPGFYRLQEQMSAASAVAALLDPDNQVPLLDVAGGDTMLDVTVVAGSTRPGIYSKLAEITCTEGSTNCLTAVDFERVAATTQPATLGVPDWAVEQINARGEDPKRLEGMIVPGQYVVNPEGSAEEILTRLLRSSEQQFTASGIVDRSAALGLSPYQLVTAASLVEREAPAEDFDKVARVILNRLAAPMRLEFDSTVNYGLTEQEIATTDQDRARVTAWNTYAMDGLPHTPISAASIEAIEAMENPAEGTWLFFVTVDLAGTTVFTSTYDEHLAAVDRSLAAGVLDSNR